MARAKRRDIQIIFTALPEFASECEEHGVFLPLTVPVPHVVETVELLLQRAAKAGSASFALSGDGNG
jgi:hypothetical protein